MMRPLTRAESFKKWVWLLRDDYPQRRAAERRLSALLRSPAATIIQFRRWWLLWRLLAEAGHRIARSLACTGVQRRAWATWCSWASCGQRIQAYRLIDSLSPAHHRRRFWRAMFATQLRRRRYAVYVMRASMHYRRRELCRAWQSWSHVRNLRVVELLWKLSGRSSATILDWTSHRDSRLLIFQGVKLLAKSSQSRAWRAWQHALRLRLHTRHLFLRARRFRRVHAQRERHFMFQSWSVGVLAKAFRADALQHWADEFAMSSSIRLGWRRWCKGLSAEARRLYEMRRLNQRGEDLFVVRVAAALNFWSAITARLHHCRVMRRQKQMAKQEEVMVQRLRLVLSDGRRWAERMLIADGMLSPSEMS